MKKTTEQKIAEALESKKQTDKALRELRKQKRAEELAIQKQRHAERGAIAEKLIDEKAELSNEDFQKKIETILNVYNRQNRNAQSGNYPNAKTPRGEI